MSESEDEEIFDDEEMSDSNSGSIRDDEMGSEFADQSNGLKSPNVEEEEEEEDANDQPFKIESFTANKGNFVTVPVEGDRNMSPDGQSAMESKGEDEFEESDTEHGKLNWQAIFLEEKMSGEPQSIPQSVIYELVNETINKEAFSI